MAVGGTASMASRSNLAVRRQSVADGNVGVLRVQLGAQLRERPRVAGPVAVQESQQVRVGAAPGLGDGGAVTAVLGKDDQGDAIAVAPCDLYRAIGRTVGDDGDRDVGNRGGGDDLVARRQAAIDDRADALLLVEHGDGDE